MEIDCGSIVLSIRPENMHDNDSRLCAYSHVHLANYPSGDKHAVFALIYVFQLLPPHVSIIMVAVDMNYCWCLVLGLFH